MFNQQASLFDPARPSRVGEVVPWKPHALTRDQWPPDYRAVFAWRIKTLTMLRENDAALASARAYYADRPGEFIQHWMDTYNPRKAKIKWMPFVFFWRQHEFIQYLEELRAAEENGLVEKCRDIGATWLVCAYTVWCWIFIDDFAFGWGSRKENLVDKLGDPDSIFEKMRLIIKRLPDIWVPEGFKTRDHATFMKLINPANGSTVTGEAGDNIGRGGRKAMYGKDESAHYARPELIEAALGDNTNVQLDISSVNGLGNVFHRRREAGIDWSPGTTIAPGFTWVFIFDWSDHPEKTQEWYDQRKAKAEREGMQHVFAQEVDRNYSAAVQNTIIAYEWIKAAIDAHKRIPVLMVDLPETWGAGLDVADEGMDRNALALRQWVIVRDVREWGARDPGVTAREAMDVCRPYRGIQVQYDNIGMGTNVKSEYNRLVDEGVIKPEHMMFVGWNAGAEVINKYDRIIPDDDESLYNKDFFGNFKAQAWWSLRSRFYKTWRVITALNAGEVPPFYAAEELISLDGSMTLLHQLCKELAQPTRGKSTGLRTIVDKTPDGTKSPNLADAVVMAMFPVPDQGGYAISGAYSG